MSLDQASAPSEKGAWNVPSHQQLDEDCKKDDFFEKHKTVFDNLHGLCFVYNKEPKPKDEVIVSTAEQFIGYVVVVVLYT